LGYVVILLTSSNLTLSIDSIPYLISIRLLAT